MSSHLKAPPPVALTTAFPPSAPRCRRFCSTKFRHCSILEASNFWKCKRPPPSIGGGSAENLRLGSTSGEKYTNLTSEPPISGKSCKCPSEKRQTTSSGHTHPLQSDEHGCIVVGEILKVRIHVWRVPQARPRQGRMHRVKISLPLSNSIRAYLLLSLIHI